MTIPAKNRNRRRIGAVAGIVLSVAWMTGCSSHSVTVDYDHSVNFAQYKSFQMMGHEGHGRLEQSYSSLTDQRINQAIRNQMISKGFAETANADLLINYTVTVQDKQSVTTTTAPMGFYGGYGYYRAGFYRPWPAYATQTQVRDYKQGTLLIDIIDNRKKMMIWGGAAQGTITQKKIDNLDQTINEAVADILADFPPGSKK